MLNLARSSLQSEVESALSVSAKPTVFLGSIKRSFSVPGLLSHFRPAQPESKSATGHRRKKRAAARSVEI